MFLNSEVLFHTSTHFILTHLLYCVYPQPGGGAVVCIYDQWEGLCVPTDPLTLTILLLELTYPRVMTFQ